MSLWVALESYGVQSWSSWVPSAQCSLNFTCIQFLFWNRRGQEFWRNQSKHRTTKTLCTTSSKDSFLWTFVGTRSNSRMQVKISSTTSGEHLPESVPHFSTSSRSFGHYCNSFSSWGIDFGLHFWLCFYILLPLVHYPRYVNYVFLADPFCQDLFFRMIRESMPCDACYAMQDGPDSLSWYL